MHRNVARPMSPHLTIWRWGPHMLVSILHRVTGGALTFAGLAGLTWWLVAAATSREAYATFTDHADNWYGVVIGIGLSWALFQHSASGLRHLVMDIGAGFEIGANKVWANVTIAAAAVLTALLWLYILAVK